MTPSRLTCSQIQTGIKFPGEESLSPKPISCDAPPVSDPFQQAVADSMPILQRIRDGFGPYPTATQGALERLQSLPLPTPRSQRSTQSSHRPARTGDLAELRQAALACEKCPHLAASRTQVVFGVGHPQADLMFVSDAPSEEDDKQGEPFVDPAGHLLTKIIQTMGFSRDDIYIAHVVKCRLNMRPGDVGNRKPTKEEMSNCLPWLEKQIEAIQPLVIVALGATAVASLLGKTEPLGRIRGHWLEFHDIPVMPTYHPAYLLRNQALSEKRKVWEDMLKVLERLGKSVSEKQRQFFSTKN